MTRPITRIVFLVIIVILGWRSVNYVSSQPPSIDSGAFLSVAHHLKSGSVLYRDVWDHKPPLIYFLDYLALEIGDGTVSSVRLMEKGFVALGGVLCFGVLILLVGNAVIAFLGTLFFLLLFSSPRIFEGGNLTEEYGVVLLLGGIYLCILAAQGSGQVGLLLGGLAGSLFGASILTKEPFIFSCAPWIAHYTLFRQKEFCFEAARIIAMILGLAVPLALACSYFVYNHAMLNWFDVLSYNYQYVARSHDSTGQTLFLVWTTFVKANGVVGVQSIILWLIALAGIGSIFDLRFVKENGWYPITVVVFFATSFFGVALSGWNIGAYFMQLAPAWIFLGAYGTLFVGKLCSTRTVFTVSVLLGLLALFVARDHRPVRDYWARVQIPFQPYDCQATDPLVTRIKSHMQPGDTVWQSMYLARIYFQCDALSPTTYIYAFPWFFLDSYLTTATEKAQTITSQLKKCPPRVVVLFRKRLSNSPEVPAGHGNSGHIADSSAHNPYDVFVTELLQWLDREYSVLDVVHADLVRWRDRDRPVSQADPGHRNEYWIYAKRNGRD